MSPVLMCAGRASMPMCIIATTSHATTTAITVTTTAVGTVGMAATGASRCHTTTAPINGMIGTITSVGTDATIIVVITMAIRAAIAIAMITIAAGTGATIVAGTMTIAVATGAMTVAGGMMIADDTGVTIGVVTEATTEPAIATMNELAEPKR
ncbi:hypothetical protein M5M_03880 [Simiduia agarivorans SA1 = DSM 21679]|uniref:Uncharacterized protein n=1 Tax=Simiduia agarivorans (strain DSM 21679 / JCM 13881 / BCRC 17597 / SA1) TaxID=1117647 RepID=K4KIF4_SIMAS|nr:hypothetical protein M5M_03880 [Simiduia agarivorans SA1 = DSM 21679]